MTKTLINIASYLSRNVSDLPVVYIAGKVTDLPYSEVFAKFKAKQLELEQLGFYVINPCDHIGPDEDWQQAMRIAVILLAVSGNIFLLPDWPKSKGATLERNLSLPLGINTMED